MGLRSWLGNKLFKIDDIVDRKMGERMQVLDMKQGDALLKYKQEENKIWASASADRLLEFYKTNPFPSSFTSNRYLFWYWIGGRNSPKMHYPAPAALLNSIKSLIFGEEPTIEYVSDKDDKRSVNELNERVRAIFKDNNINNIYQNAAALESYSGGVAFKINYDDEVSNYPIIELYPQERLELKTRYGRLVEIVFLDNYKVAKEIFTLKSKHGIGYINYELYNGKGKRVALTTIKATAHLEDKVFPKKVLTAVYKKNRTDNVDADSAYGGSDFEGVVDLFHQIDELFSSMALYIRNSRPIISMTEDMLKTTEDGKNTIVPKAWENDVVVLQKDIEANQSERKIYRDMPKIEIDQYTQGIRLLQASIYQKVGMDTTSTNLEGVGANQSGDALQQREKSTVILYQNKVKGWQHALQELVPLLLMFEDFGKTSKISSDYDEYELNVGFPDYQSASFADKIEMFTKAYTGLAVDLETMVKKIWNEELEEEQIMTMVKNIKIENGVAMLQEQIPEVKVETE